MRSNCLKATEPLRGDSLLFTTNSPWVSSTNFIDLGRMKGWDDLGVAHVSIIIAMLQLNGFDKVFYGNPVFLVLSESKQFKQ